MPEPSDQHLSEETDPELLAVLESAARLQELVPDAVLVGGSAAAYYAGHRRSFDHDHVVDDLRDRFDSVLDAVQSDPGWVTTRLRPGKMIMGELGDIETGISQLTRLTPLETAEVVLPSGRSLRVPTADETLRVKGFLIVRRNQVRDYLDVVALAHRYGTDHAAAVLADLDSYYGDQRGSSDGVASQLIRQLAEPHPKDRSTTGELATYKGLHEHWHAWSDVTAASRQLALEMLFAPTGG